MPQISRNSFRVERSRYFSLLGTLVFPSFIFLSVFMSSGFSFAETLKEFHWHDGNLDRKIYLNPSLIAEFDGGGEETSSLKKEFPDAELHAGLDHKGQVWKLSDHLTVDAASSVMNRKDVEQSYSPVFQDGVNSGQLRYLPGNVVVKLDPRWTPQQVEKWRKKQKLKILKKVENQNNVFLVETEPGLQSLHVANRLYESKSVLSASPNWVRPMVTK